MSSTGPKLQTQKNTGTESVGRPRPSRKKSSSVSGKHADAAATSAGIDATGKSINNPVGIVPALGHLKPEDLSCVDRPEELVFSLPYIPPINIPAFESRVEKAAEMSDFEFRETVSPTVTVENVGQYDPVLTDSLVNNTSPSIGHALPGTCHLVNRPTMPLTFTGTTPVLSVSTLGLQQNDLTPTSPRFALPEPTVNKFKLTDNPSFLQQALFADAELMLTGTRATSRDFRPTHDLKQADAKSVFQNVDSSCIRFTLAGTEPAFLDPSFPDTALVSSRPDSTGKTDLDNSFTLQSRLGLTETTPAQMPPSGADQTSESQTLRQNAESLGKEAKEVADPKNAPDECLGFKRRSPLRHSDSCSDCSEEEKTLMMGHNFSQEQLTELREAYLYFASPGDQLHQTNFGSSLRAIGQNPSEEDLRKMLIIASVSPENGYITLDNYLKAIGCWGLRSEVDMIEDLIQAFKVFDDDDDETLDPVKIRAALQNHAESLDEEGVNQLLQLANCSPCSDGKLSFLNVIKAMAAHYIAQDLSTHESAK